MSFGERFYFFITKWVCCSLIHLTVACRIIASIGIMISLWLVVAFANDKFRFRDSNFAVSRKTALVLGLDWQHLHTNASLKSEDDPDGNMIAVVIAFYSFALLGTNLFLFVGTMRHDWCFSLPWLIIELLSCISKFGALIFHWKCDFYELKWNYFLGSIAYLVISIWWWLVVFATQLSWRNKQIFSLEPEMYSLHTSSRTDESEGINTPPRMHRYKESYADLSAIVKVQNTPN